MFLICIRTPVDIYTAPVQNDWIDIIVKICRIFFFGPIIKRHVLLENTVRAVLCTLLLAWRPLAHCYRARAWLYAGEFPYLGILCNLVSFTSYSVSRQRSRAVRLAHRHRPESVSRVCTVAGRWGSVSGDSVSAGCFAT